jgi:alpha-L-fucosidase
VLERVKARGGKVALVLADLWMPDMTGIYATRPWSTAATTTADGHQVRYTQKDGTVFAIVLADDLTDNLTIRDLTLPPGSRVGVLNGPRDLAWIQVANDVRITPSPQPRGQHAHVLAITTS